MIKAEEIINKQFSRAFWGYDIGEVDTFLDEIVRANERAEQELEIAQLRIRMLLEELEHYTGKREDAKEATGQKAEAPASSVSFLSVMAGILVHIWRMVARSIGETYSGRNLPVASKHPETTRFRKVLFSAIVRAVWNDTSKELSPTVNAWV